MVAVILVFFFYIATAARVCHPGNFLNFLLSLFRKTSVANNFCLISFEKMTNDEVCILEGPKKKSDFLKPIIKMLIFNLRLFCFQTPNGLPTVNSYVTAPSIPPYHPPTQVSPYMGYSATTSAYVTGATWQPASGSALSPHSCDIATPLAFMSMSVNRDAIHPVPASLL